MIDQITYDKIVAETWETIVELSKKKGGEYSGDHDRLENFRRNGTRLSLPMEVIWSVYAAKHWDAITQYVADLNAGKTRPRMESLKGRCDDLIVYLILFKAMLHEREQITSDPLVKLSEGVNVLSERELREVTLYDGPMPDIIEVAAGSWHREGLQYKFVENKN
jgi:hypothetical protein